MRILVGVPKMDKKIFKIPNPLYIWMLVSFDQHSDEKSAVSFDDLFISFDNKQKFARFFKPFDRSGTFH